jgi:hypothetical protein
VYLLIITISGTHGTTGLFLVLWCCEILGVCN